MPVSAGHKGEQPTDASRRHPTHPHPTLTTNQPDPPGDHRAAPQMDRNAVAALGLMFSFFGLTSQGTVQVGVAVALLALAAERSRRSGPCLLSALRGESITGGARANV